MIVEFPTGRVIDNNKRICPLCGSEINLLVDDYFVSPSSKVIACTCSLHSMRWRIFELNKKIQLYKQDRIFKPKIKTTKRGNENEPPIQQP